MQAIHQGLALGTLHYEWEGNIEQSQEGAGNVV